MPESLLDEPLDSLPYWDRFYRFVQGEYQFTGESPKAVGQGSEIERGRAYEVVQEADLAATQHLPGGKRSGVKPAAPKSFATLVWEGEQRRKRNVTKTGGRSGDAEVATESGREGTASPRR